MRTGKKLRVALLLALVLTLAVPAVSLANWPQFLGPNRDGIVQDADGLPTSYSQDNVRLLWQTETGPGFGGAAIHGDSVLIIDRVQQQGDVIRRLRLTDGQEVWRRSYAAPGSIKYAGSRSTPATDGKLVFTVGPKGHFSAVTFARGEPVWQKNLLQEWGAQEPNWSVAQSPLLVGNMVVVAPWGRQAAMVAYEKASGRVVWTTPNNSGKSLDYQSVVPMMLGDRLTLVASGKRGYTIGVDAGTGEQLWSYGGYTCSIHVPSPTVVPDDRILLTGGYGAGSAMIQIEQEGNSYAVRELWKNKNLGTRTAQALIWDDHIYANSKNTGGGLRCLSLDGEILWDTRQINRQMFDLGNILIVGGHIFQINGQGGELFIAEATPEGYKELGRINVLDGQQVWGPLAYSDGLLVMRDQKKMVCLDLKPGSR